MPDRDTRGTMSFRAWGRTKERLEELGKAEKFAHTTLIGDTAEILAEWITCSRCGEEIPAVMGDCTGKPLRLWVADATAAVYRQKCKDHHPVLVGTQPSSQSPVSTGTDEPAATTGGDAGERTEPRTPVPAKARKEPIHAAASRAAAKGALKPLPRQPQRRPESDYVAHAADMTQEEYETKMAAAKRWESHAPPRSAPPVAAESTPAETVQHLASKVEEIAPGTVLFQQPGAGRVVTAEVPQPADHGGKRGRAKAKCSHITSGGRCKICEPR